MVLDQLSQDDLPPESSLADIKQVVNALFWSWFEVNKMHKFGTVRKWFISKTFYVQDLEQVFILLFGPPPVAS